MKTDSTVELMDESRLLLREMTADGVEGLETECTWAEMVAVAPEWGLEVSELRAKLVAGRKAVIGGGGIPVHTLFWPEKGIATGGEPLAVEKLEAEKLARAALEELVEWANNNRSVNLTGANKKLGEAVVLARRLVAGGAL